MPNPSLSRRSLLFAALAASLSQACSRAQATPQRFATRVVSLTPNTTETLFAIGAGAQLVGRSRYCDYPKEAAAIRIVGGYVDVSLETLLALQPDLVVGARGPSGSSLVDKLTEHGIKTFFPPTESVDDISAMILGLSELLGRADAGARVVAEMKGELAAVASAVASQPKLRALLIFGLSPIVAAGPGSFPNQMLELAGAQNALQHGPRYPTLGIEEVISAKPDLIIDAAIAEGHGKARIQKEASGWSQVPAVQADRVFALQDDAALRPGPRLAAGVRSLARILHTNVRIP